MGKHNEKRSSYGHSIIIDPWGVILAHITEEAPGYAIAEIDTDHLKDVRRRLPVWTDRRPALYGLISPAVRRYEAPTSTKLASASEPEQASASFAFGPSATVQPFQIFARTPFSVAFVNHRPVLPGHVLVSPLRSGAKRLSDLTPEELLDFFSLVQKVQTAGERMNGANSSTIAIQDGVDAGQSVEHLHVHIVPRKGTDFGGQVDEIYTRLMQHDKTDSKFSMPMLTEEQMTTISRTLADFLHKMA